MPPQSPPPPPSQPLAALLASTAIRTTAAQLDLHDAVGALHFHYDPLGGNLAFSPGPSAPPLHILRASPLGTAAAGVFTWAWARPGMDGDDIVRAASAVRAEGLRLAIPEFTQGEVSIGGGGGLYRIAMAACGALGGDGFFLDFVRGVALVVEERVQGVRGERDEAERIAEAVVAAERWVGDVGGAIEEFVAARGGEVEKQDGRWGLWVPGAEGVIVEIERGRVGDVRVLEGEEE